ncbi:MAG: ParB/RepB/Spo0J family partition protein [Acidobacteriaceae bacterium]
METTVLNATEYRNVSLSLLTESKTNPRRIFDDAALQELAASIRAQGVLSPLLVRPLNERSFEIVAGARRYRAAQMADAATVPVRIVKLTDAQAVEMSIVENLQRKDVHPLEEAQGFRALLNLDEPKYSIEQIAAKTGKHPAYVAARLKLTGLAPAVVEAFYREEIGVGHALLLAKLQSANEPVGAARRGRIRVLRGRPGMASPVGLLPALAAGRQGVVLCLPDRMVAQYLVRDLCALGLGVFGRIGDAVVASAGCEREALVDRSWRASASLCSDRSLVGSADGPDVHA